MRLLAGAVFALIALAAFAPHADSARIRITKPSAAPTEELTTTAEVAATEAPATTLAPSTTEASDSVIVEKKDKSSYHVLKGKSKGKKKSKKPTPAPDAENASTTPVGTVPTQTEEEVNGTLVPTVIRDIEDLCVRIHNNTAFAGVEPFETRVLKNAYECQKTCVSSFPKCVAVMFYFVHNQTDEHICYLFDQNSIDPDVQLIQEKPKHDKDIIRALEIVVDCHQFDPFPPLGEDGVVASTDKVPRSKRESGQYLEIETTGPWTPWGACMPSGIQARSQACEYGRKIQRRGCPARNFYAQQQQAQLLQQQQQQHYDQQRRQQEEQQRVQAQHEEMQRRQQQEQQQRQQEQQQQVAYPPRAYADNHDHQRAEAERARQEHLREYERRQQEYQRLVEERRRLEQDRARAQYQQQPHYQPTPPPPPPQPLYDGSEQLHPAIPESQIAQCPNNNCAPRRPPPPPPPACRSAACIPTRPPLGIWQEWSEWSLCSCTCGDGIKQRRRECTTDDCGEGEAFENTPCTMGPCETWSEWCEWSPCSSTCGAGEKQRTRYCLLGTQRCEGKDFESERCDSGPCPEWSQWEDWSQCSTSCGHGFQSRQRTCLGGAYGHQLCAGDKVEQRPCDHGPCSAWSQWQEWGLCSVSCGDGVKRRERVCQGGTDCIGESVEDIFCSGPPCSAWSVWAEWSACSVSCGAGQKTRARQCQSATGQPSEECFGDAQEIILCHEQACATWSEWCEWSPCSADCGGGISLRSRICEAPGNPYGDNAQCPGPDRETRRCNEHPCAPQCKWTEWCPWSPCSAYSACDSGVSQRSRQCVGEPGCSCRGLAEESQQCRGTAPCTPPPPPPPTPC